MSKKLTISEIVDDQIKRYRLPNNSLTKRKMRKKFTETLKNDYHFTSKNIWENAPKVKVAKTEARVFDEDIVNELLRYSQNYLQKLVNSESKLTPKQVKAIQKENVKNYLRQRQASKAANYDDIDYDADDKAQINHQVDEMIEQFKTKAVVNLLFNKYFTEINVKKLRHDLSALYFSAEPVQFTDDPETIQISHRLDHPEGNYYKRK